MDVDSDRMSDALVAVFGRSKGDRKVFVNITENKVLVFDNLLVTHLALKSANASQ